MSLASLLCLPVPPLSLSVYLPACMPACLPARETTLLGARVCLFDCLVHRSSAWPKCSSRSGGSAARTRFSACLQSTQVDAIVALVVQSHNVHSVPATSGFCLVLQQSFCLIELIWNWNFTRELLTRVSRLWWRFLILVAGQEFHRQPPNGQQVKVFISFCPMTSAHEQSGARMKSRLMLANLSLPTLSDDAKKTQR